MLGLIAALTPVLYKHVADRRQDIDNINEANTLLLLKNAAAEYIEENKETLTVGTTQLEPADVGIDIEGYKIGIRKEDDGTINAMVAATDAGSDMKAAKVASLLGVSAGIYSAQDTSKAWGINGVWAEDVSNYGFTSLPTGVPVVTTAYDKDVSAGINEEQLKDIIENTTYAKISADELCLAGECVTTWEDVVFDPIEAIRNCNLGDVASCVKGFQKGINTSCEAIGKTYKDNGGIALTGFYTLARSSNTFDANQPCVFKDGNVADVPEVITQCNADSGGTKAACRYAWNNSINRSCEQVIAANKSASSGWYNITTSTNASSKACYFVNIGTSSARVGNAQETITTCNAANTNSNVACRFGYDKNYNRSCARIIATWTSATTAFYTLTAASSVSL
ncbi:MAG: hypothetical protein IKD08_03870, partial [Alphaproteobacteria bacterium]|nr:hypothetical protein [Alphaproteobacteria bacterium]